MFANDKASSSLGMEVLEVAEDFAKLCMEVRDTMLNGHATCHGGMMFALADSAFAFASNSTNKVVVAAGCDIEYFQPAYAGDLLTATCKLRARRGRTTYYDTRIVNAKDETIAIFRGRGREIPGEVVPTAT